MELLITNAKIFNDINRLIDVDILINDGKITKISTKNNILLNKDKKNLKIINANNNLVMPGFINSNSNLLEKFFYDNRSFNDFQDFSSETLFLKKQLTDEEKYLIYKFEILKAIKNGITTFCDADFYNLSFKKAILETNARGVYKVGKENPNKPLDKTIIKKITYNNDNFILGLKGVLYNLDDDFNIMLKLGKTLKKPIICNSSYSLIDAGMVDKEFNTSTINLLEEYGFLNEKNIVNNANILDKEDYNLLKFSNTNLIFSPSFLLLTGVPNANIYALSRDCKIGLSSFKNDYFLEMLLLKNLENNNYDKLNLFTYNDIFKMATINNAEILSLKNCGKIKEGYYADLVIYNIKNIVNENQILNNLTNNNIISTIINGIEVYNQNSEIISKELISKLSEIKTEVI